MTAIERYGQLGDTCELVASGFACRRCEYARVLLRSDPAIAPLLGDLISAQAVIIPEAHIERVLAVLRDSGYQIDLG